MDNIFVISTILAVLFFAIKFIEMKYLDKEDKPLKFMVRDTIIVFCCGLLSTFGYFYLETYINDFFNIVTETKTLNTNATQIFTDEPGF